MINAFETCHTFFACLFIALIKLGLECPKELTAIPCTKSRYFLPLLAIKKLPFPLLKDNDGKILHKELYEKYTNTEEELVSVIEKLVSKGEMEIGVAYSLSLIHI